MSLPILRAFAERNELPWSDEIAADFGRYRDLLVQFNARQNLVGTSDPERIERELLVDSVVAAVVAPPTGRVIDVGCGAGLPSIPLALMFRSVELCLVEPRQKRAQFLKIANQRLKLGAEVVRARIEETELVEFDYAISKAFQPPATWLETAHGLVRDGGTVVVLHAADATEELDAEAARLGATLSKRVEDVAELGAWTGEVLRSVSAYQFTNH